MTSTAAIAKEVNLQVEEAVDLLIPVEEYCNHLVSIQVVGVMGDRLALEVLLAVQVVEQQVIINQWLTDMRLIILTAKMKSLRQKERSFIALYSTMITTSQD